MRGFLNIFSTLVSLFSIGLSLIVMLVCLPLFLRLNAYHPASLSIILDVTDYRSGYFDGAWRKRQFFLESAPSSSFVYHLRYGQVADIQRDIALGLLLNANYAPTSEGVLTALQIAVFQGRSWEVIQFILDSGGGWRPDKPASYTYRMVDEATYYMHHPQYLLIHRHLAPLF